MSRLASVVGVSMVFITGITIINELSYQKKKGAIDKQLEIERQRTIVVGPPFKNCKHMQQYFNTIQWVGGEKVKAESFENMEISDSTRVVYDGGHISCGGPYLSSGSLGYITITSPQGVNACKGIIYYKPRKNTYSYQLTQCRWIG